MARRLRLGCAVSGCINRVRVVLCSRMTTKTPGGERRELLGMSEVAEVLGVSRQRADQLSRTAGFPEAVRLVLPVDELTREAMAALEDDANYPRAATAAQGFEIIAEHAYTLPDSPRLWRRGAIERWARDRDI